MKVLRSLEVMSDRNQDEELYGDVSGDKHVSDALMDHVEEVLGGKCSIRAQNEPAPHHETDKPALPQMPQCASDGTNEIDIDLTRVGRLIKPGFAIFRAQLDRGSSFAHDRGVIDHSRYYTGIWDLKADCLVADNEAGVALAKDVLSVNEAKQVAIQLLRRNASGLQFGDTCSSEALETRPRLETAFDDQGRLEFSILSHVGQRGCYFNNHVLVLPQSTCNKEGETPLMMRDWDALHIDILQNIGAPLPFVVHD